VDDDIILVGDDIILDGEVAHLEKGDYDVTKKYVLDLLKETRMSGFRPADTLIYPNQKLYDKQIYSLYNPIS